VGFADSEEWEKKCFCNFRKKKKTKNEVKPYLDSNKHLAEGDELDFDNKAYEMLHRAQTEWFVDL